MSLDFYRGKRVLVTGHTGFKGAYMVEALELLGAKVTGYALLPETKPNLYDILKIGDDLGEKSVIGDIADFKRLFEAYKRAEPEIVFHLAAQPIVSRGYSEPLYTYKTNVMGTVNVMECVRLCGAESVVNVTTDKVYQNGGTGALREDERLDGFDPYANSKSCSELVTAAYRRSYFDKIPVSTARAGNVIGGGDFAEKRIVPDCCRALLGDKRLTLRCPSAVRPFQHVLEAVTAYLVIAQKQCENFSLQGSYNVGPDPGDAVTVAELVRLFEESAGERLEVRYTDPKFKEAGYLSLDNSKIKEKLGVSCVWDIERAVRETVRWTREYASGGDAKAMIRREIREFLEERA